MREKIDSETRDAYEILEDYYEIGETIGSGGFAKVKKATHLATGERVAIKIMDKASLGADLPRVSKEIDALKTFNHIHICKLYQVFETTDKIFMVMEYCRGGELFDYIVQRDRLEEIEARRFFRQIASAVAYIHSKGVAHRDLKPENVLLDGSNNIKLIDFGLCAAPVGGSNVQLETCCGSPAYAAPELVKGERYIGPLADVWSLGVLLYALLNGFLPFEDPSQRVLYQKIMEGKYEEPKWLSEGTKSILRCMLSVNPQYRLSVNQLLNHTWCQQGKQDPIPLIDNEPYIPLLDNDILKKMSFGIGKSVETLRQKLRSWDYSSYETATYLILLNRKEQFGSQIFLQMPMRLHKPRPVVCSRLISKTHDSELSDADSVDANGKCYPSTPIRPYHASMEGGLDDYKLLQLGSPKTENKENKSNEFLIPLTPSKNSKFPDAKNINPLSPARSADSGLNDVPKTPAREKWKTITTPVRGQASPRRNNVFGSIEKSLDRFRLMLTPKSITRERKKLRTVHHNSNKAAFNISAAGSQDPDCVITELKEALAKIGIESEQRGYCLVGKSKQVKFELEVVALEPLGIIGVRRKRHHGDSWTYKKIVEQVLSLTGVSPYVNKAKNEAILQTQV